MCNNLHSEICNCEICNFRLPISDWHFATGHSELTSIDNRKAAITNRQSPFAILTLSLLMLACTLQGNPRSPRRPPCRATQDTSDRDRCDQGSFDFERSQPPASSRCSRQDRHLYRRRSSAL